MSYKVLIGMLLSVSMSACSQYPTMAQTWPVVDHFQMRDNVVVDIRSDLMWTRCLLGATWNGMTCEGTPATYTWQQIQTAVKAMNYAGYSDWRVPTLNELKLLADKETMTPIVTIPHLNQSVFPMPNCHGVAGSFSRNQSTCWQWSSTPIEGSDHYVWMVYFGYGYGSANYQMDEFALRLVRNK